jgi:dolichol kinase
MYHACNHTYLYAVSYYVYASLQQQVMYCLCGVGLAAGLFPKHIAILGMMQLAVGDPIAALAGYASRSIKYVRKLVTQTVQLLINSFAVLKQFFNIMLSTLISV